jgi:hypothetical protein
MFTTELLRHQRLSLNTWRSFSLEPQLETQRRIVATGISQQPSLLNTST